MQHQQQAMMMAQHDAARGSPRTVTPGTGRGMAPITPLSAEPSPRTAPPPIELPGTPGTPADGGAAELEVQLAEANALAARLRAENVKLTAEGRGSLAPRNRASPASRRGPATPQSHPTPSTMNASIARAPQRAAGRARARSRRARRRRRRRRPRRRRRRASSVPPRRRRRRRRRRSITRRCSRSRRARWRGRGAT